MSYAEIFTYIWPGGLQFKLVIGANNEIAVRYDTCVVVIPKAAYQHVLHAMIERGLGQQGERDPYVDQHVSSAHAKLGGNDMTVPELIELITDNSTGQIYPFSFAANMMAAYDVPQKLVQFFHDAAARENRAAYDRSRIFADYKAGKPYLQALLQSFHRINPPSGSHPGPDQAQT